MYSNNTYSSVTSDLGRLHLGSSGSPQQYSPGGGKKVAPLVPPKPKKGGGIGAHVSGLMYSVCVCVCVCVVVKVTC